MSLLRDALFLAPFAAWVAWRAWMRRRGRPTGPTPWSWLAAAGGALVGLALMAAALLPTDNRNDRYIPGEGGPDGPPPGRHFEAP